MKYIQIASYPRSGNRWISSIMAAYFHLNLGDLRLGYHGWQSTRDEDISNIKTISIRDGKYKFIKSHLGVCVDFPIHKVVYIKRYPLSCFVSALNFLYLRKRKDVFKKNEIKDVDKIFSDGEMSWYFDASGDTSRTS